MLYLIFLYDFGELSTVFASLPPFEIDVVVVTFCCLFAKKPYGLRVVVVVVVVVCKFEVRPCCLLYYGYIYFYVVSSSVVTTSFSSSTAASACAGPPPGPDLNYGVDLFLICWVVFFSSSGFELILIRAAALTTFVVFEIAEVAWAADGLIGPGFRAELVADGELFYFFSVVCMCPSLPLRTVQYS